MSNRFKNLVFDNKPKNSKEEPKLKQNSRWKKEESNDTNRFKTSSNKGNYRSDNRRNTNRRGSNRDNRNNFNRKYKANYKKPTGPAPCAADRFGINFKNLEKFDKNQNKMMENKKETVEKRKIMKMEKKDEGPTEEEMKITLAMAEKYQYVTESEDEGEYEDDDAESVDSMEDWKPQHL